MKVVSHIRNQFPILERRVNGKPLVYLDNGATSQNPKSVNDAIVDYYTSINANVHRGIHTLSQEATEAMENSRKKIQAFINAKNDYEVIFTYIPNDLKDVTPEERETIDKMVEKLEEFDDVQTVYTNMKPEASEEAE